MSKQGKTSRFKKRYFFVVLVVVLGAVSPLLLDKLRQYEGDLAGRLLREVVERESNGYYTVTFNDAMLSILNADIEINDFRLVPNTVVGDSTAPINTFEIAIPKVTLSLENIYSILFRDELTIKSVRIVDPEISMLRTNEPQKKRPFSLEAGDLYSVVSQYLKLFKIEYFQIEEGAFNYDNPTVFEDTTALEISRLNFEAKNFLLDSASEQLKRVFYTDEIELVIHDQALFLPDSIHKFSFGKLHLSTSDGLVRFEQIKVAPRSDIGVSFYKNPDLINLYDISVPSLHLSGVDFLKAYSENMLFIDSVSIDQPSVLINDEKEGSGNKEAVENGLSAILINYFDQVYIRSANINKARMNLHLITDGKDRGLKLENANIKLGEFRVDSSFFGTKRDSKEYFKDIELSFDNYRAKLADSVHQVFIKHFRLSSFDNIIELDSLRSSVRQDIPIKDRPNLYLVYLPKVNLTGFDWHAIANNQMTNFGNLEVSKPEVRVNKYGANKPDQPTEKMDMAGMMDKIKPFTKLISFDSISVDQGLFHWLMDEEELFGFENVEVDILGFHMDKRSLDRKDRLFFSDEIAVKFSDFDVETPDHSHHISLDEFMINTRTGDLTVDNINIRPMGKAPAKSPITLQGSIDKIAIEDISLLNIYHEEHYILSRISLVRPNLKINKYTQAQAKEEAGFPDWLGFLSVEQFDITRGALQYTQDEQPIVDLSRYDISLNNFTLDSVMLARKRYDHRMDDLLLKVEDMTVHLTEIDHDLIIKSIAIDQRNSSLVTGKIDLKPLKPNDSTNLFLATAEGLSLNGFDLRKAVFDREWRINKGAFTRPMVQLTLVENDSTRKKVTMDELYKKIGDQLGLISIGSFEFDSGSLEINADQGILYLPEIDFALRDFDVRQGKPRDPSRVLFARDYSLELSDPQFLLPQLKDSVHLQKLTIIKSGEQIILDSIYFSSGSHRDDNFVIQMPQLSIKGLRLPQLLEEQKLRLQSVHLTNPLVQYAQQTQSNGGGLPTHLPLGSMGVAEIHLDSFFISNSKLGFRDHSQTELTGLDLTDLNITVVNLKADTTTHINGDKLFWNDDIILSGAGMEYYITDSLNKLEIGGYRTSLKEKRLTLTDVNMNPTVDRDAYAIQFGEQTDYINAAIDSIDFTGINWRALVFDDKIDIGNIKVRGLNLSTYRDKRVPRGEEKYKGLPHMNLQELDQQIEVGQFDLSDGKITYTEHVEESSTSGTIAFIDLNATFTNLVNTPEALSKNEVLTVNASTQLMGHGKLTINANANLKDEKGSFLVVGKLEKMDLTELNRMMEHVAFVKIRSGINNSMEFNIEANEDYALGEITFYYEDLKISMISKKDEKATGMGPALGSFFANAFIINSNNPRWLFVRKGGVFYERNVNRSIFNYLSKSVLSGVVASIGARSNKRDIKRKNKEAIKLLKEQRKEERMLEERVSVYD